jgi:hypothetical protein
MKTTVTILSAIFILQINFLFGNNDGSPSSSTNREPSSTTIISLAPLTPKEASFEEEVPITNLNILAPVTPKEATFEDEAPTIELIQVAPVTPKEATFED